MKPKAGLVRIGTVLAVWTAALAAGAGSMAVSGAAGTPEPRPYWIYLQPARDEAAPRALALSPRAEARLARVGRHAGADPRDYGIAPDRLAALRERGITPRRISRWLQAASALLTPEQVDELFRDPRVRSIVPVSSFVRPIDPILAPEPPRELPAAAAARGGATPADLDPQDLSGSDYGGAWEQLEMLGIPELHERGYSGAGVLVALFDTGFRKDHESLASLDLLAERDYVGGDGEVGREPGDPAETHDHGTYTWSALGGFAAGRHLGAAYRASYVLARTEDVSREVHLEEDNYIAALEWADSLGVEIVSTSLGYRVFSDGTYTVDELDGETLPITLATAIAAERGILVVTAMGNEGPAVSTLSAPADGKRVVAVGAVDFSGNAAGFSSRGPTGDGRTKPDVAALGTFVSCASASSPGAYTRASGTSLATPLAAGLAALLVEARPAWTPDSLLAALRSAGDASDDPDNARGWGIPDGIRALRIEGDRLRVEEIVWTEIEEDGDGIAEWGEQGSLALRLRNDGEVAAAGRTVRVGSHDATLRLLDSATVALPEIAPGESFFTGHLATVDLGPGEAAALLTFFAVFGGDGLPFERKGYLSIPEAGPAVVPAFLSPNPVREGPVRISLHPAGPAAGALTIVSPAGRRIRRFDPSEAQPDGFFWDLRDESGREVPSGIYLVLQRGRSGRLCVLR